MHRILLAALCVAFGVSPAFAQSLQPPGWADPLKLPEAVDRNPDPRIVEIDLEAVLADVEIAPGRKVTAWTYNGVLPGPLIRVNVGDRLIVHFTNNLTVPTTVHWHGLQVPIQMDGVPGSSQPDVEPNGGTFTYDFVVPDAGLYWYHPHIMSAAQVGFGLYGPLIVDDPDDGVGVEDEIILVLSDIALTADGQFEDPNSGGSSGMAFGREGTDVLINGKTTQSITIRSGAPQRWRIVNAAKSRYFLLDLDGQNFRQIGVDGGLMAEHVDLKNVLIATGERVDLVVTPKVKPGETLELVSLLHNRGYGSVEFRSIETLLSMVGSDMPEMTDVRLPEIRREIAPIDATGATEQDIELTIAQGVDGIFTYGINGVPFATGKPLLARLGETQVWTVRNSTKWSHPFHLHGFFFQVLDDNGQPVRPLQWKDTVDVPFDETVKLIVKFDDDRPGTWMYHCHILDHADGGLMGTVIVGEPSGEPMHHHEAPSSPTSTR